MATLGCSGPKLFSSMASARRISGSASASRLVSCSSWARLLRRGDVGMLGAEALLVDGQRAAHQRLGLGQPVGGLQQPGQVVEVGGDVGWSGPKLFSSMASARRISGSASASRLVACSSWARLLRSVATLGWSGPKLFSSMASARRSAARPPPAGWWPAATGPGC